MLGFGLEGAGWAQVAAVPGGVTVHRKSVRPTWANVGVLGRQGGLVKKTDTDNKLSIRTRLFPLASAV